MYKLLFRYTLASVLILAAMHTSAASLDTDLPAMRQGKNLADCLNKLTKQNGGWCEIRMSGDKPSISSVWPSRIDRKVHMTTGPASVLGAWNSAAFDEQRSLMYFTGGGHADYGGNEVYEFDLNEGRWARLTDPSPLEYLFVTYDYNSRPNKPWRKLCWMPNVAKLPGSAHTYDGLQYSTRTETIFNYVMRTANGSCFEDKEDRHKDDPAVLGKRMETSTGWYEFNPSRTTERNGLPPLSWRKVFDYGQLKSVRIHQGFPRTAELSDGRILFGSNFRTVIYDPTNPSMSTLRAFSNQADWGDGTAIYDPKRDWIWSIHGRGLLSFEAKSGLLSQKIRTTVAHGKSLAQDKKGDLVLWSGGSSVYTVNPDARIPDWLLIDWKDKGPKPGTSRVYGKWVYLKQHDVFAGISNYKTGFFIYKQPTG